MTLRTAKNTPGKVLYKPNQEVKSQYTVNFKNNFPHSPETKKVYDHLIAEGELDKSQYKIKKLQYTTYSPSSCSNFSNFVLTGDHDFSLSHSCEDFFKNASVDLNCNLEISFANTEEPEDNFKLSRSVEIKKLSSTPEIQLLNTLKTSLPEHIPNLIRNKKISLKLMSSNQEKALERAYDYIAKVAPSHLNWINKATEMRLLSDPLTPEQITVGITQAKIDACFAYQPNPYAYVTARYPLDHGTKTPPTEARYKSAESIIQWCSQPTKETINAIYNEEKTASHLLYVAHILSHESRHVDRYPHDKDILNAPYHYTPCVGGTAISAEIASKIYNCPSEIEDFCYGFENIAKDIVKEEMHYSFGFSTGDPTPLQVTQGKCREILVETGFDPNNLADF